MMTGKQATKRLASAGYVSHYEREACRWCAHGSVTMHGDSKRIKCGANDAIVSCGGWCQRFARVVQVKAA